VEADAAAFCGEFGGHGRGDVGMKELRKQFFFEKKNKKTFVLRSPALKHARPHEQKFFAELFYKKATSCLVLS
jgi:hypothetical protein